MPRFYIAGSKNGSWGMILTVRMFNLLLRQLTVSSYSAVSCCRSNCRHALRLPRQGRARRLKSSVINVAIFYCRINNRRGAAGPVPKRTVPDQRAGALKSMEKESVKSGKWIRTPWECSPSPRTRRSGCRRRSTRRTGRPGRSRRRCGSDSRSPRGCGR